LELVRDQGIQAIQPTDRPRRIELGLVVLTIFPQAPEDPAEENNNSIGIRLQYGSFAALLFGDAEAAERRW
jgi:beta-lactamase superfamily II metal-dependent hydrolase